MCILPVSARISSSFCSMVMSLQQGFEEWLEQESGISAVTARAAFKRCFSFMKL